MNRLLHSDGVKRVALLRSLSDCVWGGERPAIVSTCSGDGVEEEQAASEYACLLLDGIVELAATRVRRGDLDDAVVRAAVRPRIRGQAPGGRVGRGNPTHHFTRPALG